MKNIAKIIAAGSVLFALAACSHVAKYTTYDFVAIAASSYTVNESTTTLVIPVCAYPENGETNTTVTFDVKDGSAVAGTDYTFSVPSNGTLVFTSVGYKDVAVAINGKTTINVVLEDDAELLEQAIAVGYGSAKKISTIVGSVSTVNSETVKNAPSSSALDQLQGQVAGLSVLSYSGIAGDNYPFCLE